MWIFTQKIDQFRHGISYRKSVAIQQKKKPPGRNLHRLVIRGPKSVVPFIRDNSHLRKPLEYCLGSSIARRIVNDQEFRSQAVKRHAYRAQTIHCHFPRIVGNDNNRHLDIQFHARGTCLVHTPPSWFSG